MTAIERQSNETILVRKVGVFLLAKMTIEQARRLLGKEARSLTDEELERDIDAAEVLKDIFFTTYQTKSLEPKMTSYNSSNVP